MSDSMSRIIGRSQRLTFRPFVSILAAMLVASSLFWSLPASAQLATTLPQEDSKPLSRYAFERVEGDTAVSSDPAGELSEVKSAKEFRENITKPIDSHTAGRGASGDSGELNDSVQTNETYARTRIKQAVEHPAATDPSR